MYDAMRMEITNTSADPSVTGWYDYAWVTGADSQVLADDAVSPANHGNRAGTVLGRAGDGRDCACRACGRPSYDSGIFRQTSWRTEI